MFLKALLLGLLMVPPQNPVAGHQLIYILRKASPREFPIVGSQPIRYFQQTGAVVRFPLGIPPPDTFNFYDQNGILICRVYVTFVHMVTLKIWKLDTITHAVINVPAGPFSMDVSNLATGVHSNRLWGKLP